MLRFGRQIDESGNRGLHSIGEFVLSNSRCDLRIVVTLVGVTVFVKKDRSNVTVKAERF